MQGREGWRHPAGQCEKRRRGEGGGGVTGENGDKGGIVEKGGTGSQGTLHQGWLQFNCWSYRRLG